MLTVLSGNSGAAAVTVSVLGGAEILRVHDVAAMVDVVKVVDQLRTNRTA